VYNAGNEVAVRHFLDGRLPFTGIAEAVAETLERCPAAPLRALGDVLEADARARRCAEDFVQRLAPC
jgi:1-deoxy-D-xylulose-5-phosphate reductoisomerase